MKKKKLNIVYSTNPNFDYSYEDSEYEEVEISNDKQRLYVSLDRKRRAGKEVTLIEGFRGKPVPVKVQMVVTQSSFFLLVGLSVLLIIRDTSQLLIVQRLLNQ